MKKIIQVIVCIIALFGVSLMYALNTLNKDSFNKNYEVLTQANVIEKEDKYTFFGMDVWYYKFEKINDNGAYEVVFEKSQLYDYVPFIFAGGVTLVVTILFLISYGLLYRHKRSG